MLTDLLKLKDYEETLHYLDTVTVDQFRIDVMHTVYFRDTEKRKKIYHKLINLIKSKPISRPGGKTGPESRE